MREEDDTIIIEEGDVLPCDLDKNPTNCTTIKIEGDFDFDIDRGPHFSRHPKLKEFITSNNQTSFTVIDGVLYLRLCNDTKKKEMNQAFNSESGLALVCCPPQNPNKDIILPDNCSIIFGSAFYGCKLQSLTIPDSLQTAAYAAFYNVNIKKLYIPNRIINIYPDFAEVNNDVTIMNRLANKSIDDNVISFWKERITASTRL